MEVHQIESLYTALIANVIRSRRTITAIFLEVFDDSKNESNQIEEAKEKLTEYLKTIMRQSDFLFDLPKEYPCFILLTNSREEEANAFLQRLFFNIRNKDIIANKSIYLSASIAEIANNHGTLEELMETGRRALKSSMEKGPWELETIPFYKKRDLEQVRISILEDDEIFSNVLLRTIENMDVEDFELEIKIFKDGYEFLQSDWYLSAHTHIIIMNDILSRQNGLDVLHNIRKLPNNKKFIVYMMTKRNSEEEMIYAYESGVDHYLVKPFNLRLFEVQLKRTFTRLWS